MKIKIKSFEEIDQNKPDGIDQADFYFAYFSRTNARTICNLWLTVAGHDTHLLDGKHCYVVTKHPLRCQNIYIPDWFVEEVIEDED